MPKGILEFNLPEEETEFKDAQNGSALKYSIQDFDNWLRGIIKHGEEKDQLLDASKVREKLYEILDETGWNE